MAHGTSFNIFSRLHLRFQSGLFPSECRLQSHTLYAHLGSNEVQTVNGTFGTATVMAHPRHMSV